MAETNEFFIKIGADVNDAMSKLNQLSSQLSQLASSTQRNSNTISNSMSGASKSISSAFSSIGVTLSVAGIAASVLAIGKSALTTAAQLEQTKIAFEVFTGSAIAADAILSQFKTQAINSPMQFQDIVKGGQILLQYGLDAKQTIAITRMLGDISGGSADKFQRLSLAFGQVNASGRLMGQEARQMINAGFNPLQAISDKTGQSMAVLTQRMHDGQISVKEVADAFIYATSEGGRFFGMADKQSQTLQGQFNKLSESFTFVLGDLGNLIADSLKLRDNFGLLGDKLTELQELFTGENAEAIKNSETIKLLNLVIRGLVIVIENVVSSVKDMGIAFNNFITNDPIINFFEDLISVIGDFLEKIPLVGSAITSLKNRFNEVGGQKEKPLPNLLGDAIPEMEKRLVALQQKADIQIKFDRIGYNKTIDDINKLGIQIDLLKKGSGRGAPIDLGFSAEPSKMPSKKKATQKYETIAFPDFISKDVGSKIKAFIQENKDAATTIANWWSTSETKRLAELKKNYDKDVEFATKYELDLTDIQRKYESERSLITQKFSEGKVSAREDARKKIIDQSTRDVGDALKNQSRTLNGLFTTLKADDAKNSLGQFASSIYSAQRDFAMNISVGFAEIAGAALSGAFSVEDAFKALGSMFTSAIGDLLIKVGTSAIELGLFKEGIEVALKGLGGGAGMVALGIAAIAAGTALKSYSGKINDSMSKNKSQVSGSSRASASSGMTSGSSYQYGGSSYSTQSLKLSIDLTGAITATQTGYQINKSLETTLRVTGR